MNGEEVSHRFVSSVFFLSITSLLPGDGVNEEKEKEKERRMFYFSQARFTSPKITSRRACLVRSLARTLKCLARIVQESSALAGVKQDLSVYPRSIPKKDRWCKGRFCLRVSDEASATAEEDN